MGGQYAPIVRVEDETDPALAAASRLAGTASQQHGYPARDGRWLSSVVAGRAGAVLLAGAPGSPGGVAAVEHLPWDSQLLQVSLGRVALLAVAEERPAALAGELLAAACEVGRERRWNALWLRAAATDEKAIRAAERGGAELMGTLITLERDPWKGPDTRRPTPGFVLREAATGDIPRLQELAAVSYVLDRYHRDSDLDRQRVNRLWAASVENAVRGRARAVLVVELRGEILGFITLHMEETLSGELAPETGVIGLVAVAGEASGQGLGRALIEEALRWFARTPCRQVSVGTQGDNVAAVNLYLANGFRMGRLWLDYRLRLGPSSGGGQAPAGSTR